MVTIRKSTHWSIRSMVSTVTTLRRQIRVPDMPFTYHLVSLLLVVNNVVNRASTELRNAVFKLPIHTFALGSSEEVEGNSCSRRCILAS